MLTLSRSIFGAVLAFSFLTIAAAHAEDAPAVAAEASESAPSKIGTDGQKVSVEYTLKLTDGTVADTSEGREPLMYVHGGNQILPTLEKQLVGLAVGESKHVSLTPAEAYGEVNPAMFQTVPATAIPEESRKVGVQLMAQSPSGEARPTRVHEIKGEEIVMNHNHPLAGEALEFDIKIVKIE